MDVKELEQRLKNTPDRYKKLDLLEEIAGHFYDLEDYQKAVRYYHEAEKLAPHGNLMAYFLGQKGICQYLLHHDEEALKSLVQAKDLFDPGQEDFLPEAFALVHYFLGSLYEYNGQPEASLESRSKALQYLDHLGREAQWMLLAGLSRNCEEKGEHKRAIEYNLRAISLIGNDEPELAYLYENMGVNHYELGEYEKALSYFSKVLEVDPDFERKDEVFFNVGLCYQRLTDFKTALDSYLKLLEIKTVSSEDESLSWLYLEIAHCYYQLKDYRKSLQFTEEALKMSIRDKDELAEIHSFLANNYYALGHFEEAAREGEKTLKISENFRNLDILLPNLAMSFYQLNRKDKFRFYRDWCNRAFPELGWTKQLNKLKA